MTIEVQSVSKTIAIEDEDGSFAIYDKEAHE